MQSGSSYLLSAYCVPGTVLGTEDGLREDSTNGPGALVSRDHVLLIPQPISLPVEAHGCHCLLSEQMNECRNEPKTRQWTQRAGEGGEGTREEDKK